MTSPDILSDINEVDLYRKLQEHFDSFPVGNYIPFFLDFFYLYQKNFIETKFFY